MIADIIRDKILRLPSRPIVLIFKLLYIALMLMIGPFGFIFAFSTVVFASVAINKDIYYILPLSRKQMKRRMIAEYSVLYIEIVVLLLVSILTFNYRYDFTYERYDWVYYILAIIALFFSGFDNLMETQVMGSKGSYSIVSFMWGIVAVFIIAMAMKMEFFESIYSNGTCTLIAAGVIIAMSCCTIKYVYSIKIRDYLSAADLLKKGGKRK